MDRDAVRSTALRVAALALLLLLALAGALTSRTLSRLPDATVYFVVQRNGSATLEAVTRRLGTRDPAAYAAAAVRALADGPTAAERSRGLASAVPEGTRVTTVRWSDGTLFVDLDPLFTAGGGSSSMIARLEQLRWTLTQPNDVNSVALFVGGSSLSVLGGEGVMVENPWTRSSASPPTW